MKGKAKSIDLSYLLQMAWSLLVLFLTTQLLFGCRSDIKTFSSQGKSAAISIDDNFVGQRTHFQSRSIISFTLGEDQIKLGDSFSLINLSNDELIIEEQNLSLTSNSGFSVVQKPAMNLANGLEITITIYPVSEEYSNKFLYGINELRLDVQSDKRKKFHDQNIVLQDFSMFGSGGVINTANEGGPQLEGWFGGIVRPIVKAQETGHVLRAGFFHSINH